MVSLSLKDCSTPTANENGEGQLIKLDENQAANVPFPPGCPVLVVDSKSNITTSGLVTAVYVSFIRNTGSCNNCYSVASKDTDGNVRSQVVSGALLRYAINCTIKVSPRGDGRTVDDEGIDGIIKGFEIQNDGDSTDAGAAQLFLYSVEVCCAAGTNTEEAMTVFRHRGISPEHIRFRQPNESESDVFSYSFHPDNEKTSVVSLDDASDERNIHTDKRTMNNNATLGLRQGPASIQGPTHLSPLKSPIRRISSINSPNEFASPSSHPHLVCDTENRGQVQKQSPCRDGKMYSKCTPLPQPHPTHFCGNFEKAQNERIPDFSYLSNFPQNGMMPVPAGTKCCVMCGELRSCNGGKSSKTKSMKSAHSPHASKDTIVIPNQNKGLCTLCDVNIWVVNDTGLQIKWCKGCKNFQSWATFGEKGSATKCVRCRERQREKYAASKNKLSSGASSSSSTDGVGFSSVTAGKRKLTSVDNERAVKRGA